MNLSNGGKRRSNKKFIEAVAVEVDSCKGPTEVFSDTSLGTPEKRGFMSSNGVNIQQVVVYFMWWLCKRTMFGCAAMPLS